MSDLISREVALKRAETCTFTDKNEKRKFMDWMNYCLDAAIEPQWIPCNEKLPEESGEYLVWYDCGEDIEGCCVENFDAGVGAFGRWCDEYDAYTLGFLDSEFIYFDEAVAWMPLPQPYKGE